jgi:IS605 OrfB family transposase
MKLTAQIKLLPSPEQANALRTTLVVANSACEYISHQAWETQTFRQFSLHTRTYRDVRDKFQLSAQVVVRCLSKVADAYKIDHKTKRTFRHHGAIAFDSRILSYDLERKEVSIWTMEGRQRIPFSAGARQLELLSGQRGESDLCYVKGKFYLVAVCDVETPKLIDVEGVLGVDLGIVNLASDSDGENFSGSKVDRNRRIFEHRRRNLQKKQTRSAKRKLRTLSGKQARFQKHTNHTISKQLVAKAQDTCRAIALEDLSGIRKAPVRRSQRSRHSNWSFHQLRQFVSYKAERAGIPVVLVDPHNTSRTCPACGCVDKANRVSQRLFSCIQCGYSGPADIVAAVNISARAVVNQPMVTGDAFRRLPAWSQAIDL